MAKKTKIRIKPANRGKFNATKKRTGKSTEELTHSSNPLTRRRAVFAQNAAKWHDDGGFRNALGAPTRLAGQAADWLGEQYEQYTPDWLQEGMSTVGDIGRQINYLGHESQESLLGTEVNTGVAPLPVGKGAKAISGARRGITNSAYRYGRQTSRNATRAQELGKIPKVGSATKVAGRAAKGVTAPPQFKYSLTTGEEAAKRSRTYLKRGSKPTTRDIYGEGSVGKGLGAKYTRAGDPSMNAYLDKLNRAERMKAIAAGVGGTGAVGVGVGVGVNSLFQDLPRGYNIPGLDTMEQVGTTIGNTPSYTNPNIGHAGTTSTGASTGTGTGTIAPLPQRTQENVSSLDYRVNPLQESAALPEGLMAMDVGAGTKNIPEKEGGFGFNERMLRSAPAVGAGISALFPSKPEVEQYGRIGQVGRLTPQQVDEAQMQSQIASQYGRTRGDISNVAQGSGAAARAGIIGVGFGAARAKSQGYANLASQNAQRRMQAEQFGLQTDLGVAQANQRIGMQETIANAQNRAAARSAQRADITGLVGSIGGIGTEAYRAEQIGKGTGYFTNPYTGEVTKGNTKAEGGSLKQNKPTLTELLKLIE